MSKLNLKNVKYNENNKGYNLDLLFPDCDGSSLYEIYELF
jgi:hypothetical protein